jgi:hypothetical protein
VILALAIAVFILPAYVFIFGTLFWLLIGGACLFTGIKQIRQVKVQGERIHWYKQPFIVIGLTFVIFATPTLDNQLISGRIATILFSLLAIVLSIYDLILLLKYIRTNNLRTR